MSQNVSPDPIPNYTNIEANFRVFPSFFLLAINLLSNQPVKGNNLPWVYKHHPFPVETRVARGVCLAWATLLTDGSKASKTRGDVIHLAEQALAASKAGGKSSGGGRLLNQWLFFLGTHKRWDRWHRINPPVRQFFFRLYIEFLGGYMLPIPPFMGTRNNHGLNGVSLDLQEGIRKLFQWGDGFFHQQKNPKKSSHSGLALNKIVLFPTSYGMFVQKHRFLFGHLEYHLRLGFAYRTHSTPKINSSPLNTADQFKRKVYVLSSKHHF